jgi:hypothetical protein
MVMAMEERCQLRRDYKEKMRRIQLHKPTIIYKLKSDTEEVENLYKSYIYFFKVLPSVQF